MAIDHMNRNPMVNPSHAYIMWIGFALAFANAQFPPATAKIVVPNENKIASTMMTVVIMAFTRPAFLN